MGTRPVGLAASGLSLAASGLAGRPTSRYAWRMNPLFDSFWRALAYCLHPRIIWLSLAPLALLMVGSVALAYFFGQPAMDWIGHTFESSAGFASVWQWLDGMGWGNVKKVLVPLVVILLATPLLVIACLLMVAWMMAPAIVAWVAERRFPTLQKKVGSSFWRSLMVAGGSTVAALVALGASVPFWVIPPVVLVVPPLIWGWLTYRVMSFDALVAHASPAEIREIMHQHRGSLLLIGLICGFLGATPSVVWASGAIFVVFFLFLVPLAVWLYTMVFAFSSLWFTHYCLTALQTYRQTQVLAERPPLREDAAGLGDANLTKVGSDLPPSF